MCNKLFLHLLFFFIFFAASCDFAPKTDSSRRLWMQEKEKMRVLCTTGQVAYIVQSVGREHVHVYTLFPPLSDPHTYELVKGDQDLFEWAQMIFFSGLGLEGKRNFLRYTTTEKAVCLSDDIQRRNPSAVLFFDSLPDPHIWMDVSLWAQSAYTVADALSVRFPEKREQFMHNAHNLYEKLLHLHKSLRDRLQKIDEKKRYLLTSHHAFRYFVRAYLATNDEREEGDWEKRSLAPEGLAADSQMSTRDVEELISVCIRRNIHVLFPEFGVNRDSLAKLQEILREKKQPVQISPDPLFADSLGPSGTAQEEYPSMILYDASVIEKELQ